MYDLLFTAGVALLGGIIGALIGYTIENFIENYVKPFFNRFRRVQEGTVVKISQIRQLSREVSYDKRKQAEGFLRALESKSSSDVVIFGKDSYTGQTQYQIVHDVNCDDLNNFAYNVTPTGHKQKIYIG